MPLAFWLTCVGVPALVFTLNVNAPVVALVIQYCWIVDGTTIMQLLVSAPTN
jgi:hypothetical protein